MAARIDPAALDVVCAGLTPHDRRTVELLLLVLTRRVPLTRSRRATLLRRIGTEHEAARNLCETIRARPIVRSVAARKAAS